MPTEKYLSEIGLRLRNEVQTAVLNWATIEAFNNRSELIEQQLREIKAWSPAELAIKALVRDVIITLMRITDPPGDKNDLHTFCMLAKLINGMDAREVAAITGADESDAQSGIKALAAKVPPSWNTDNNQLDQEVVELRKVFRPIRDALIAHSKSYKAIDVYSSVPQTRQFLKVAAYLSNAASLIIHLPQVDFEAQWQEALSQSTELWTVVLAGSRKPSWG